MCAYEYWRSKTMEEIKRLAHTLLGNGFVRISSCVTKRQKERAWYNINLAHLLERWKKEPKVDSNFNYYDKSSHPSPPEGRNYHFSSTSHPVGPEVPLLITNNFFAQAVVLYLLDPSMRGLCHFGHEQTHTFVKLLMRPLWCFFGKSFMPRYNNNSNGRSLELEGSDSAWMLVNFPNAKKAAEAEAEGKVPLWKPSNVHIDAGENCAFEREGIPPLPPPPPLATSSSSSSLLFEDLVLNMLLHQLAILFYCDTPGRLGAKEGATAFVRYSHLSVLEGLFLALNELNKDGKQQEGEGGGGGGASVLRNVPWKTSVNALKRWGDELSTRASSSSAAPSPLCFEQPELEEGHALLALGVTVHSAVYPSRLMENEQVRAILNCKIKANKGLRKVGGGGGADNALLLFQLVSSNIPQDSPLRLLARSIAQQQDYYSSGLIDEQVSLGVKADARLYMRLIMEEEQKAAEAVLAKKAAAEAEAEAAAAAAAATSTTSTTAGAAAVVSSE